jgi:hypothetical protein
MTASLILAAVLQTGAHVRDSSHDFDFESGKWTIDVRRLEHPLSGSKRWAHPCCYQHIVHTLWPGASLAQLLAQRPSPHFTGLMMRLYNAKAHEWSVYWSQADEGAFDPPLVGQFKYGRGVFVGHDTFNGRSILVRVVYSDITPTSFRTVQSFSPDGGKTWEPNLIQLFTRVSK